MTIDTITTTVLTASEGHYLTDGEIYGTTIYLGQDRTPDEYTEITEAEYEEIMRKINGEVILEEEEETVNE